MSALDYLTERNAASGKRSKARKARKAGKEVRGQKSEIRGLGVKI